MRRRIRPKYRWALTALVVLVASVVVGGAAASASLVASPSGATIQADQADYPPGSVVTLTGSGWQAGESVHLAVNDSVGNTWSWSDSVSADQSGNVTDQLTLPDTFVANYSVTAIGDQSGTATNSFTDTIGAGSLEAPMGTPPTGAAYNPTHWAVLAGDTITDTINGASDALPYVDSNGHIPVFIKINGVNYTLTGTFSNGTISFSWTVPAGACATSNVAYGVLGLTTNNLDNPKANPNQESTAGFAFVDATGSVVTCGGGGTGTADDLTVTKTAVPSYKRTYTWGITKSVDHNSFTVPSGSDATPQYTVKVTHDDGTDSAWTVSGIITVHNPNSTSFTGVNVTDAIDNGGSCLVDGGSSATVTVPAAGTKDVPYTCTFSSNPGSGMNTATATWDATANNTLGSSANGPEPYDFSGVSPTIVDGSVTVSDPLAPTPPLPATVSYTQLSPITINYSHTFSGDPAGTCTDHPNTASFATIDGTGTGDTFVPDQKGSDSQTVKVCVGADLTVKKDATPAFKRTYTWNITKAVDKTIVRHVYPGTATFNYTVKASHSAAVDSGWQVTGSIKVTNPNDWEAVTYDLSDALDTGSNGSCSIDGGGTSLTVAASSTTTSTYTCTFSVAPSPSSGTNTATATWDSGTFSTPDGSATGTAAYAFGSPTTTVDNCVTVTDKFNGVTTTLGSPCATSTSAQTFTFTYSHTVNVPQLQCVSYDNTATFTTNTTGTTGSAGQTVKVCPTVPGLTMGYWSNKNGQGRITSEATSGTCPTATYLLQYAPFQGGALTSTSTCAQTAAYVYNVIKGGGTTCASTTCNAMLKAQMLSTALNVHFSVTPGGEVIDLVNGCKMIDSSTLTATCSGAENWSPAFNNQAAMTVTQMLVWAASKSNVGGSAWYLVGTAQSKTLQVLAKDAFDAINNGVALSA